MKLFICSPAFDSKFVSGYVDSLFNTLKDLQKHDVKTVYKTIDGMHWIDMARDALAAVFLKTDCDYMLQIDADLAWTPESVFQMLKDDKDVIGGAYRVKSDTEAYAVKEDETGLHGLAGGFLMVRRNVIEKMTEIHPKYIAPTPNFGMLEVSHLFTREFSNGSYTGEDFMFCKRAKQAGFELHVYPDIQFTHYGLHGWTGNYKDKE